MMAVPSQTPAWTQEVDFSQLQSVAFGRSPFPGGVKLKKKYGKYGLAIVKNGEEMLGYLYKRSKSRHVSYGPVSMTVLVNLEVGIVAQAVLQFSKNLKPKITQQPKKLWHFFGQKLW